MAIKNNPFAGNADYWWYKVRGRLLENFFGRFVNSEDVVLDVGSSDGPSARFIDRRLALGGGSKIALDIAPEGLGPDDILGSVEDIPVDDESFTIVSAFDVIEHVKNEAKGLDEIFRVLKPGGQLLISVPAYQWAWSKHDENLHHYRRYTASRAAIAAREAGFIDIKTSYGFFGTFPIFVLQRLRAIVAGRFEGSTPAVSQTQEKILMNLSTVDAFALKSGLRLPWGSSVFLRAQKPF